MARLVTPDQLPTREPNPSTGVASYNPAVMDSAAPGLALAQTASQVGGEIERMVAIEQEKDDTTRVEDAWNKYKTAAVDMTAGDQGVLHTKGGDAVNGGLLKVVDANLKDARANALEGMTPEQQRRFSERANATDLQVKTQVVNHVAAERTAYAQVVMQGQESAAKVQIGIDPANDITFQQAKDLLDRQAATYLDLQGIKDKDARSMYLNKLNDSLWTTRIDKLLYQMPEMAEAKFRAAAENIVNPELRLQYQAKTREVSLGVISTQDANQFITETRQNTKQPFTDIQKPEDRTKALVEINRELTKKPGDADLIEAKYVLENGITTANTSGLPNARDVAAQLPLALSMVEKKANERYGPSPGNPDRAAYIARTTAQVIAINQRDVQQINAVQEQAAGVLLDAVGGVTPQGPAGGMQTTSTGNAAPRMKLTNFSQIQANPDLMAAYQKLDYKQKLVVQNALDSNLKKDEVGNPGLFNELRNRIALPPNDQNKINWWQTIEQDPRVQAGGLNITQLNGLRSYLKDSATDDGRAQQAKLQNGVNLVKGMFQGDMILTDAGTNKGKADYALALWQLNADKIVGLYKQQNKPIDELFDPTPGAKNSLVTPQAIAQFKTMAGSASSTAGALANAAAAKQGEPTVAPVQQPANIDTREKLDAWFKTLPAGTTTFVGTDGKARLIPRAAEPAASPAGDYTVVSPAVTGSAPAGAIVWDSATGQIKQLPIEGAPAPAMDANGDLKAPAAAPQPAADDIPTLDEGPIRLKGARTEEQKVATQARLAETLKAGLNVYQDGLITFAAQPLRFVQRAYGGFLQVVKALSATDEERAVTGFRAIVKQGTFRANEDTVLLLNNFIASKKGTEAENLKAAKMLKVVADKLGVEITPKEGGGGGGGSMTAIEAEARARSGVFDDGDTPKAAAPTPTGYKTGTDDKRGSVTPAQETQLRGFLKQRGFTDAQINEEVAKLRKR